MGATFCGDNARAKNPITEELSPRLCQSQGVRQIMFRDIKGETEYLLFPLWRRFI